MVAPDIITLPGKSSIRLLNEISAGLAKVPHERTLPTMLLYDEEGLRLYDKITTDVPEYYLFPAEESILKEKSGEIIAAMCGTTGGDVVLELGAGSLRKTSHLLRALARADDQKVGNPFQYLALDLEYNELIQSLTPLVSSDGIGSQLEGKVQVKGLCGTFNDGIEFIRSGGLTASAKLNSELYARDQHIVSLRAPSPDDSTSSTKSSDLDSPAGTPSTTPSSLPSPQTHAKVGSETPDCPPLHILFLGSSIGNFSRTGAAEFLCSLPLRGSPDSETCDTLLLGLDHRNPKDLIELAYNEPAGVTKRFMMNGLNVANKILGGDVFREGMWELETTYNEIEGRHEGYYKSMVDQEITLSVDGIERKIHFCEGELVNIEFSYKYSDREALELFKSANLRVVQRWTSEDEMYSVWLLHRPPFQFPILEKRGLLSSRYPAEPERLASGHSATFMGDSQVGTGQSLTNTPSKELAFSASLLKSPFPTVPTLSEWSNLWAGWDTVTLGMIPPDMMHQKPIDLRHKCLFYLGHIPTFLDIHLAKLFNEPHTEPEYFKHIFERGIDPHVDDPTQCHPHSDVPEEDDSWPTLQTILDFQYRVRARLQKVYEDEGFSLLHGSEIKRKRSDIPIRKIARVLWMTYEHEAFHIETLLYMLLQRAGSGTLPPPAFPRPNFAALASQWDIQAGKDDARTLKEGTTVTLGPADVWLGHDDFEVDDLAEQDLTHKDIQGHEFGWDNESPRRKVQVAKFKIAKKPITNGEYYQFWKNVKEKEGEITLPLPASWVELAGSIMVRTLYGPVPMDEARHWPFVSSYDDLSKYVTVKGGRLPTEAELRLFKDIQETDEGGSNLGFSKWHYVPPFLSGNGLNSHNGGIWEWTSTILDKHEGFVPSVLYPGYSSDFFDGIHHVVLGGSFATIPRLAQRRSFRNYYQHNYPYAWIGGRVVYDDTD